MPPANPPELTARTTATLVSLGGVILASYTLSRLSLLRVYPRLHFVIHALVVLASWSAYATVRSSPRRRVRRLVDARHAGAPRCDRCGRAKPDGTHHCSRCAACTVRMSHHCGILGVCVGAHNRKAFLLLLFYGVVSAALLVVACFDEALGRGKKVLRVGQVSAGEIVWFQMYYLQYCMVFGLGALLSFHLYLVAMGRTVLDVCRFGRFRDCFPPWRARKHAQDQGVWRNFEEVFGRGWTVLLPVVEDGAVQVRSATATGGEQS